MTLTLTLALTFTLTPPLSPTPATGRASLFRACAVQMWGTLVVTLPSVYSGAVLHVYSVAFTPFVSPHLSAFTQTCSPCLQRCQVHSPTKPGDSLSFAHFSKEVRARALRPRLGLSMSSHLDARSVSPTQAAARATRSTAAAPSGVQWAAFYADCYHEVDELTAGSRVALVYNLTGKYARVCLAHLRMTDTHILFAAPAGVRMGLAYVHALSLRR